MEGVKRSDGTDGGERRSGGRTDLLGAQKAYWTYARLNTSPLAASLSMLGVCACVARDANMGHQLAGGNSSWCPEAACSGDKRDICAHQGEVERPDRRPHIVHLTGGWGAPQDT